MTTCVKEYLKRKMCGVYVAVGLHPPGLKKIKRTLHQQRWDAWCNCQTTGKILIPWWKVSCSARPISTRLIPAIEVLAVFKEVCGKPFIVLRSVTLPTNKELITVATWPSVKD